MNLKPRHLRLAAYILVCSVAILGLYLVGTESDRRDRAICESNNDLRRVLVQLIDRNQPPLTVPLDADPNLRDYLERSRERSEEFRLEALQLLAIKNCRSI